MNDLLKKEIDLLPDKPGSYQMRNKDNEIIYIGKAKNLKKRVSQYFLRPQNGKTAAMVFNVDHFTTIVTSSEKEALILEMNLIQKHHPRYNIMLMDDKHYPYIGLHTKVKDPYVSISRNTNDKRCEYFGPFPNSLAAFETVDIINKIYPLRKCRNVPKSPCLYYHMHQCLGPCINKISNEKYNEICQEISTFLKGENKEVINKLKEKIKTSSEQLEFEKANEYNQMLSSLLNVGEKQQVEFFEKMDRDLRGFSTRDNYVSLVVFIYRKGILLSKRSFVYELIGELLDFISDIIFQYYSINPHPKELIVTNDELKQDCESYFQDMRVLYPSKGKLFDMLSTVLINAKEALDEHFMTARLEDDNLALLDRLGKIINIKTPLRIELFDNSHLSGTNAIGAMVVFINGEPVKKMYRKFNLQSKNKQDDVNSMKEVLTRRYSRLKEEKSIFPDLIILDGGLTQLNAGIEVLKKLNINIPIISLVKSDKHKTSGLLDMNLEEHYFDDDKPLFFMLTRMQDEVHRFAITSHIKKRNKNMFKSIFDDIDGIGEKRRELLSKTYSTIADLTNATSEELKQILPDNVAVLLYNKLHKEK